MTTTKIQRKTKPKNNVQQHNSRDVRSASTARDSTKSSTSRLGAFYAAGPAVSIGNSIQTKAIIGRPNDAYEQEADVVADRVTTGQQVPSISPIGQSGLSSVFQSQEENEEEKSVQTQPVQRQESEEEEPVQALPVQRQTGDEEEPVQTLNIQRQDEEETVQTRLIQRQETEEEEPIQTLLVQRQEIEEEEPVQGFPVQRQTTEEEEPIQTLNIQREEEEEETVQPHFVQAQNTENKEEPVQTRVVQRQGDAEEEQVQTQLLQRQEEEEEERIQTDNVSGSSSMGSSSMGGVASQAIANKGSGQPLSPLTRNTLESSIGTDFSDVRVHNDSSAQESAGALNARAFTHGKDIWLGKDQSPDDVSLMAHEATHVVQQSGNLQRQVVQRQAVEGDDERVEQSEDVYEGRKGSIDKTRKKMTLSRLKLPTFKQGFVNAPFTLPKKTDEERPQDQRQIWEQAARAGSGIDDKLNTKLRDERAPKLTSRGQPIYFLKLKGEENFVVGNRTTIKNRSLRPFWDKSGSRVFFDVDHKRELQLGGANSINNMWLLESEANRSSGRNIRGERNRRIQNLLNAAVGTLWTQPPNVDTVRREYDITVDRVLSGLSVGGRPRKRWTLEEIRDDARQLDAVRFLTKREIENAGLEGSPSQLVIFTNETGGGIRRIPWEEGITDKSVNIPFGQNFRMQNVSYTQGQGGSITGVAFRSSRGKTKILDEAPLTFDIHESEAVDYGGYLSQASVNRAARRALKLRGLSMIEIKQAEIVPEKGLVARGKVSPTVPLFNELDIDIVIDGNDVYLSKTFSTGDFSFPGPIQVTDSSLEIFAGTQGLGVNGEVLFEVERVGKGKLGASAATGRGEGGSFAIEGEFEFDTNLFDQAKVALWYREEKFGGSGELKINRGKIKGVKSASINVNIDGENWKADGILEPDIKGVQQATLTAKYDQEKGFEIGGTLNLSNDIPGIKGGTLEATIQQREEGEGYKVKASGDIPLDIPGVDASVKGEYDDGAFKVEGSVAYEKGLLKGNVSVGVTNQAVTEGVPSGEPTDKLTAYGGGMVTIRIAPWLEGTIGLKLLPNGEIEVSGSIGLPDKLEVFPEKEIKKNIFTIGLDIPILGVAVAGQRIGIFATISGGLDASAGIGPGELRNLNLTVTYNPDRESETTVSGNAMFAVPAHAGLRLFVRGGLGAGIPIVSATLGLEIGGQLGVAGEASANVQVDWSPAQGLSLEATGRIFAEPKFKFDISGFALVEADLLLTTIELYKERWEFAAFEFGSGLRFGIIFPIKYREGEPFDISLSDVEFEYPDIDTMALLKGLVKRII